MNIQRQISKRNILKLEIKLKVKVKVKMKMKMRKAIMKSTTIKLVRI